MIPEAFARRMARVHGDRGRAWTAALPEALARLSAQWEIVVGEPFPNLTYNYAAPAQGVDGTRYALKLGVPTPESHREAVAMRAFGGQGAARLHRHDPDTGAMLLERIEPGTDLRETPDPQAAEIAADVLHRLWQAPIPDDGLAELAEWTAALERIARIDHPLPQDLLDHARSLRADLLKNPPERVVLHGDLHHANVLLSDQGGWLAIDPKGVVGERAFDILMFLLNPHPVPLEDNLRRVDVFVDRLGLDRERVLAWCLVQSVVSACWSVEDHEDGWEWSLRLARQLAP